MNCSKLVSISLAASRSGRATDRHGVSRPLAGGIRETERSAGNVSAVSSARAAVPKALAWESIRLSKLSPQHVQIFVNERLKSDLSPRTVQLSLVILHHALQTAVKWGLVGTQRRQARRYPEGSAP